LVKKATHPMNITQTGHTRIAEVVAAMAAVRAAAAVMVVNFREKGAAGHSVARS
jgi:hypothetical protein